MDGGSARPKTDTYIETQTYTHASIRVLELTKIFCALECMATVFGQNYVLLCNYRNKAKYSKSLQFLGTSDIDWYDIKMYTNVKIHFLLKEKLGFFCMLELQSFL